MADSEGLVVRARYEVTEAGRLALQLLDQLEPPGNDSRYLCSLCRRNYVDSDSGFDTCEDCRRRM